MVPYKVGLSYDSKAYGSQFKNRMFSIERQVLVATIQLLFANTLFILYPIFSFYTFFQNLSPSFAIMKLSNLTMLEIALFPNVRTFWTGTWEITKPWANLGLRPFWKVLRKMQCCQLGKYIHNFRIRPILGHFSENQHFPDLNWQFLAILPYPQLPQKLT